MSSSFHKKMKKIDPLAHGVVEGVFDIEGQEKDQARATAEQDKLLADRAAEESAAADRLKTTQVESRDNQLATRDQKRRQASAGGVTRSGSDRDFLTAKAPARKRYAHKDLLGS